MKSLLLLIILSVGVYATWGDYIAPVISRHFPREMLITNKDGDDISITLIRRDEKNVYFFKKGSPIVHSYEIAQLNFLSRCKVKLYPRSSPKYITSKHKEGDDPAQMHLDSMYEEHKDRIKQLRLLNVKMEGAHSITTKQAIERDIETLTNKINKLIYKIEDFKYRYPHLKSGTNKLGIIKIKKEEPETSNKASDLFNQLRN